MNNHPAHNYVAITPNDSIPLAGGACRALFIGVGGDVTVYAKGSATAVTFKNTASGAILPIGAATVLATNTTATSIVALY